MRQAELHAAQRRSTFPRPRRRDQGQALAGRDDPEAKVCRPHPGPVVHGARGAVPARDGGPARAVLRLREPRGERSRRSEPRRPSTGDRGGREGNSRLRRKAPGKVDDDRLDQPVHG